MNFNVNVDLETIIGFAIVGALVVGACVVYAVERMLDWLERRKRRAS